MKKRKRIMGQETEYGFSVSPHKGQSVALRRLFRRFAEQRAVFRHWSDWPNSYFLSNGSRFYQDTGGHPEYASPECLGARQLVCHAEAGDRLLEQLLEEAAAQSEKCLEGPLKIFFYRNNVDSFSNTYGCHENYLVDPELFFLLTDLKPNKQRDWLLGHLFTSIIYTGNGDLLGSDGPSGAYGLVLSQRARFIEHEVANSTTHSRGMISARDEPHAERNVNARLHIIGRDANMSQLATYLKFGVTSILLDMLEAGRVKPIPILKQPVKEFRLFSRDPLLTHRAETSSGRKHTALELQQMYFDQALSYVSEYGDEEDRDVVQKWGEVLDALDRLESEPRLLVGDIDWITKKVIIDKELEKIGGVFFENLSGMRAAKKFLMRARLVNLQYHDIRHDRGLYYRFLNHRTQIVPQQEVERAISEPPKGIRPELRGFLINEFSRPEVFEKYTFACDWSAMVFYDTAKSRIETNRASWEFKIYFSDPYEARLKDGQERLLPEEIQLPERFIAEE